MLPKIMGSIIFRTYLFFSVSTAFLPRPVSAQERVECFNDAGDAVPCEESFAPLSELTVVFANVAGFVLTLAGFAVLIMLIVGGFRYIIARGDPKAIAAARGTLTGAIVGLVFILISFLIVDFIAGFVEIPAVGTFCIPLPPVRTCP